MKNKTNKTTYAVIKDVEYYAGDCQHPAGWDASIASIEDDSGVEACIGTHDECEAWLDEIHAGRVVLGHGEAGKSYRIVEVLDESADTDEMSEEERSKEYDRNGTIVVPHPYNYYGVRVDLGGEKK